MEYETLKLIYIHGFQGDHTSFQAFPTDLHDYLRARLPSGIPLESCLYPTYKSRRPISEAAKKFIGWLGTQPSGPVILLAHSMGGLLAAEVVTANTEQSKRVIGLVAFDVPFLGMHPHVIISGIASLLPGDKENKEKTEAELNDESIVKRVRSDDVESIMSDGSTESTSPNLNAPRLRPPLSHSSSSFSSQIDDEWEAMKATLEPPSNRSQTNLSPYGVSPPSARSSATSLVSTTTSASASIFSRASSATSSLTAKLEEATAKIMQRSQHSDSRFLRWLRKHSDDPLRAMANWVIEHFQFGSSMFDPVGLRDRYQALERWNGNWINIWTEVPGSDKDQTAMSEEERLEYEGHIKSVLPSNTADLPHLAEMDDQASDSVVIYRETERKAAGKALRKERARERIQGASSTRPSRHFIVLPHIRNAHSEKFRFGSRERWERFPICNVDDEVEAHCGLFIRSRNPDYERLVDRVGTLVEDWCGGIYYPQSGSRKYIPAPIR